MASFTLTSVADVFGVGASVGAYLPGGNPERLVVAAPVTTAPVLADGSLTFVGLQDDTAYVAFDGSRIRRFRTRPQLAGQLVLKHSDGPPSTDDERDGLCIDDTTGTWYRDGVAIATVADLAGLPDPLPPLLTIAPILSKTGSQDFANEWLGYRVEIDATGGATLTHRAAAQVTATGFAVIANVGTDPLVVAAEAGVAIVPALPLVLPPGSETRVVCRVPGSFAYGNGVLGAPGVPRNMLPPKLSGTARTGLSLTVTPGIWTGSPDSFAYQWKRDGTTNIGTNSPSYLLVSGDETHSITCVVTPTNAIGAGTGQASDALVSQAVAVAIPAISVAPAVTGTAITGQQLSCSTGTWTNNPTSFAYQWKRGGVVIIGATSSTFTLTAPDEGTAITCEVTASNGAGAGTPAVSNTVTPTAQAASGSLATLMVTDMRTYKAGSTFAGQGLANGGYAANAASEAQPAGGWQGDWMFNPRAKSNTIRSGAARYIQPAGGVYEITGRNNTLCRAEVSDLQGWARYDDGTWIRLIHKVGVSGFSNLYPEDWGTAAPGNGSKSITVSQTASGSTVGLLGPSSGPNNQTTTNGLHYLFHFWAGLGDALGSATGGRPQSTIAGFFAACRIRLDPATYDPNAKYIGYMGCDAYDANKAWKSDLGIGRMKKVDANWRLFTMTTASSSGGMPAVTNSSSPEWR